MKYVVIEGTPAEGFVLHGPFESVHLAHDWAEWNSKTDHNRWVVPMEAVGPDPDWDAQMDSLKLEKNRLTDELRRTKAEKQVLSASLDKQTARYVTLRDYITGVKMDINDILYEAGK